MDTSDNSHHRNANLEEMAAAWLDGRISAKEVQLLEQLLVDSQTAQAEFLRFTQLDAGLHELADAISAKAMVPGQTHVVSHQNSVEGTGVLSGDDDSRSHPLGSITKLHSWALFTGLAAVFLIAFYLSGIVLQNEGLDSGQSKAEIAKASDAPVISAPPAPVATLASIENAKRGDARFAVGQTFHEEETFNLDKGEARISVGFGAEIVLEAPAKLTFLSRDRVQLHSGRVVVNVAPWAKGFTVTTDSMDVVDLGTTFSVSADSGSVAQTTVLDGLVRVRPSKTNIRDSSRLGMLISKGEKLSIDEHGVHKSFDEAPEKWRDRYFSDTVSFYRPVDLHNTGIEIAEGEEDSHWKVVSGPENIFDGPKFAIVCKPNVRYLPNDPSLSQWISIRNWETASANSVYTFRTDFQLADYDLSTMRLFGRFLADNGIREVRVNGHPVTVESWTDEVRLQKFTDQQFRFVSISDGLLEGHNEIEIDVWNGGQFKQHEHEDTPNHMALRVEWYAFGRQNVKETGSD